MVEKSNHERTDKYGNRYQISIETEDGTVVFDSSPTLAFDCKAHGISVKRSEPFSYSIVYRIERGRLFLARLAVHPRRFCKKPCVLGAEPSRYGDNDWVLYVFDKIPCTYTGKLTIGRDFDRSFWNHDEKAHPVPFAPYAYHQNGYMLIENGIVAETVLRDRTEQTKKGALQ